MRSNTRLVLMLAAFLGVLVLSASLTQAQPAGGGKKGGKGGGGSTETVDDFVKKLMAFNAAKDGKLTKKELTDPRLHALFDRADTNKDGVVTRDELEALFTKESLANTGGGGGKGGDGGGKGDGKKGGKKGPPQPGQILPPFLQDALNLTDDQKKQLADLQKQVDTKLGNILTVEQRTQLREIREKGPGGFGPPTGDKKGPPPTDKQ